MIPVGQFRITRIEEILLAEPSSLFAEWRPEIAAEHRDWLTRSFYDPDTDCFVTSIHSWLLQTPRHTILIDTCGGNARLRPASPRFDRLDQPYLQRLAAAGVQPDDVDIVINTHLHIDHVGWNTRRDGDAWVPTFRNATYFLSRIERHLRDPREGAAHRPPATHLPFLDSVQPILDAGKAVLLAGDEKLAEGIDLMRVPGHAPGQFAVRVRSDGNEALFIADVMHQPLQVYFPTWNSKYCEDPDLARRTRIEVLEHCAEHRSLILPGHFGAPHCGRVERRGDRFTFVLSGAMP
ncbi:MAG: MBL fold metallo-hydrolase [Rhodospirillales bacterium]|nr:MBL fold metallo-hydrolase [Rhodospirillales bacterium]